MCAPRPRPTFPLLRPCVIVVFWQWARPGQGSLFLGQGQAFVTLGTVMGFVCCHLQAWGLYTKTPDTLDMGSVPRTGLEAGNTLDEYLLEDNCVNA